MIPRPYVSVSKLKHPAYRALEKRWASCQLCPLCDARTHVVHVRGSIPAQVLLIGEAPGESEDTLGYPFVGEAGHKLQELLDDLRETFGSFTYCITNTVACIPIDEEEDHFRAPHPAEIEKCQPRLEQTIKLVEPRLIVLVGKIAARTKKLVGDYKTVSIIHPAAILRMQPSLAQLNYKRAFFTFIEALGEI